MTDHLKKVQPGDDLNISARTFNTFIDTAQWAARQRGTQTRSRQPKNLPQSGVVLVKNETGELREQGDALGIDGPIFTPADNLATFKGQVALRGVALDPAEHFGAFVVLLEPLADGKIGRAVIAGVAVALVQMRHAKHRFADAAAGEPQRLASAVVGAARILWKQYDTGTSWAILEIGDRSGAGIVGKTSGSVPARSGATPGVGTMRVYELNSSGVLVDAGYDVQVLNLGADVVATNTWCQAKLDTVSRRFIGDWQDCS